jgi:hypothetical protein
VRQAAESSLTGFPEQELAPLLASRETPPQVLSWAARHRSERSLRETALQNPSLPDETIEALAPSLSEELAELVVINQTRLLRRNSLLLAIEANPSLSSDQRRRLRELRESFRIGEPAAAGATQPTAAVPPQAAATAAVPAAMAAAAAPPVAEAQPEAPLSEAEAFERYLTAEERQHAEKVSAVQKIYRLNTAEKIVTALKGSREERAILVRDPNRLVAVAVLGSPRLTEAEIEAFSAMKGVSDEILRQIGNHREWTKRYNVINNLVRNPRTPIGIALTLVPRLNVRDVKGLAVDRNVPEPVRKQAQKFVKGGAAPQR